MMELIDIAGFNEKKKIIPHIDVRSPIEFNHAHIPGSVNIPLFTDEERAEIGLCYKQEGQEAATVLGESFAVPRIPDYLNKAESVSNNKNLLVICARGGLRSLRFSQLLENAGFNVFRLEGGYKSYRRFVLESFDKTLSLIILGGRTGCGKTKILQKLHESGEQVLDLEGLAHHRGSAFGGFPGEPQPSSEFFENCLSEEILKFDPDLRIWLEDESLNIGKVILPAALYEKMRCAPQVIIEMERTARIQSLCDEYGQMDNSSLLTAINKIHKRLGDEDYRKAVSAFEGGDIQDTASIILRYYDKCYDYSLTKKTRYTLGRIQMKDGDASGAAEAVKALL